MSDLCPECGANLALVGRRHRCIPRTQPIAGPVTKRDTQSAKASRSVTPSTGLLDRLLAKHSPDDLEALASGHMKLVTVGGKSAADRQRDRRARKKAKADG